MNLTFILLLLLVIGVVVANIALLRLDRHPMPVKTKNPSTSERNDNGSAGD